VDLLLPQMNNIYTMGFKTDQRKRVMWFHVKVCE